MSQFKTTNTPSTEPLRADDAPTEMPMVGGEHHDALGEKPMGERQSSPVKASDQPQPSTQTSGFKFFLTMIGLNISIFCVALDNTIISTAIPRITDDFHALQDVGWYGSGMLSLWFSYLNRRLIMSRLSSRPVWYVAVEYEEKS